MSLDYSKLKNDIESLGKTKVSVCREIGLSPPGYDKIFNKKSIKFSTLEAMCRIVGKPISYYINETENVDIVKEPSISYGATSQLLELHNENRALSKKVIQLQEQLLKYHKKERVGE